jgi:transposase
MRPKPLKERLTPELVRALEDRTMTNSEVAAILDVNPAYLSTVFNTISRKKRGPVREQREWMRDLVAARRDVRVQEARKVAQGRKSIEQAALDANCSERTIRRYVEKVASKEA